MKDYMIPVNVNSRFEFYPGYGWKELFITIIGAIIGGVLYFILGLVFSLFDFSDITKTVIKLIFFVMSFAIALFGSIRLPRIGLSPFEFIALKRKYSKQQNIYYYKFGSGGGFIVKRNS